MISTVKGADISLNAVYVSMYKWNRIVIQCIPVISEAL